MIKKITLAVLVLFFISQAAFAGVRIDKPKIRLAIAPGAYDSGEIKVENTGDKDLSINVYLEDWVYSPSADDQDKQFMPKGSTPSSCSNWITFFPADFKVAAGGSQVVRYTVNVPKDAIGTYYSVMFFETGGGEFEDTNQEGRSIMVKVLSRLGALFYVEADGTIKKTAEVKDLKIFEKLNDLFLNCDFYNTGNTDITVSGTFNVLDQDGNVYARGSIDETFTMANTKTGLASNAKSVNLKQGKYDLILTLEFLFGGNIVKEASFDVDASGTITNFVVKN